MTEGFRAYIIPSNKREDYFEFIEKLHSAEPRNAKDQMDCYSDPIVKFNDITVFKKQNQIAIENNMKRIGAKDISESYIDN